jgi:hypothetical protein
MANKIKNPPIPKDDYDLGKALGDVVRIASKTIEGRKNAVKGIGRDQSTITSIGEINLTINNNSSSSDNLPQTGSVPESDVEAKIQNFELRYTKSQQEFQKEIGDKISVIKEELGKKMPKWGWAPFVTVLVSVLVYFLNRYDKLQDKETEIIVEQKELSNKIDSIEETVLELKECISSEIEATISPVDTLSNR